MSSLFPFISASVKVDNEFYENFIIIIIIILTSGHINIIVGHCENILNFGEARFGECWL